MPSRTTIYLHLVIGQMEFVRRAASAVLPRLAAGPRLRRLASASALLLLGASAAAQRPQIESFAPGEGVPTTQIIDIDQDPSGRLWILSRGIGITIYDGETFSRMGGLPGDRFAALEIDADGRAWTVTRSQPRVYYRENGTWQSLPAPPVNDRPLNWASSLAVLSGPGPLQVVVGTLGEGLVAWNGETWSHFGVAEGLPSNQVNSLLALGDAVAVGTGGGLCLLEEQGSSDRRLALDCRWREAERLAEPILALYPSAVEGQVPRLWILGQDWLGYVQNGRLAALAARSASTDPIPGRPAAPQPATPQPAAADSTIGVDSTAVAPTAAGPTADLTVVARGFEGNVEDRRVWSPAMLVVDRAGGVYFGLRDLNYLDPAEHRWRQWDTSEGLPFEGVTALYFDRERNLWIGTWRGLGKLENLRFQSFDRSQGLLEDEVTAIAEPVRGRYVLGHRAGLTILDGESIDTVSFPPSSFGGAPSGRVRDIAVDDDGVVWMAVTNMGLVRFSGERWSTALPDRRMQSVEIDAGGELWAASGIRLYVRRQGGFSPVEPGVELDGLSTFRWLHGSPDRGNPARRVGSRSSGAGRRADR